MKGFPHLVEMRDKYAKDGLVVMTVSVDPMTEKLTPEIKDKILQKLRKNEMAMTNLVLDEPLDAVMKRLRFSIPPSMYVFDRAGKWTQFNELKKDDNGKYFEVEALVKKLLAQK